MGYLKNEHGDFSTVVNARSLSHRIWGSWNKETASSFKTAIKQQANDLQGSPWGMVADIRDWELCTPEVFDYFDEALVYCIDHDLCCQAAVVNIRIQEVLAKSHYGRVFPSLKSDSFSAYDDAKAWCLQQIKEYSA